MTLIRVVALALCIGSASANARDAQADTSALLRAEAALCHAWEIGDAKSLDRGLDSRFTLTSSRGELTDRASNIAEVAKRDPAYQEFRNHGQNVRLYGDAAIITGVTTIKGEIAGKRFAGDFQYTDTWIRDGGQWRLAASHASRIGN